MLINLYQLILMDTKLLYLTVLDFYMVCYGLNNNLGDWKYLLELETLYLFLLDKL